MPGSVSISESGRDGGVRYSRGIRSIEGYWSFGGGDVVAIVSMGSRADWEHRHAWALDDRDAILRLVADEVVRQRAPTCTAEIDDASGDILLRQRGANGGSGKREAGVDPTARSGSATFVRRYARLRSMVGSGALLVTLFAGALLWIGKSALSVAPANGVPLNASVRTDRHIATLIQYTDPHLPEISGRGGNTTSSLGILLVPLDGSTPRLVPVASGLSSNSYQLARILGSDGRTIWFDAAGLFGVRLDDYELVASDHLRDANPGMNPRWWDDSRGADLIDGKLHVVNDDRSAAIDVDPVTWKATAVAPRVSHARFNRSAPGDYLAAGFLFGEGAWLGLHSQDEADGEFRPGQWVRAVERTEDAKRLRRLFIGRTEPSSDGEHRRLLRITPASNVEFLNAAFLRLADNATPLRLANPDSVLMLYTSAPGQQGTVVVARVDLQGQVLWTMDTGLDRFLLQQILPGEGAFAFVGTRPPIPDKLSEPFLVLIDNQSGKMTSHSLWRQSR